MDVLEEVQPLWTYLRKCNAYGRTSGRATIVDILVEVQHLWYVLEEVQPLWSYLRIVQPLWTYLRK